MLITRSISLAASISAVCSLFTFSYHWPLKHYTTLPIRDIIQNQDNITSLESLLAKFKAGKEQELVFIRLAGTLSAAATIGVFSWPEVADTIWSARAFWFTSMILSIFSLISSTQQRLLYIIPDSSADIISKDELYRGLQVIVQIGSITEIAKDTAGLNSTNDDPENLQRVPRKNELSWHTMNMIYIWQCPMMLMSWSWVTFLVGLTIHVVRPFIPYEAENSERKTAVAFLVSAILVMLNFGWCAWWTNFVLSKSKIK